MQLPVTLGLFCGLVSAVSSLRCYECFPQPMQPCTKIPKTCSPSETTCFSATTRTTLGGVTTDIPVKTCVKSGGCGEPVSVNLGNTRTTVASKCCTSDLCNSEDVPAYGDTTPNGLQCYSCEGEDCSKPLKCLGVEKRCFSVTDKSTGHEVPVKGCGSPYVCTEEGRVILEQMLGGTIKCCEGQLCNSAE
ncbi:urokinase plasminogen activator surface receptor [Amia ocellicauda]|uniref:urokinase plasminogen activator surface receptor n=1 Tax=Amia ocellicauda TaxID=2972642 RepID=UPI003464E5EF